MESTEVERSSHSEPGGGCLSRSRTMAWTGIELLGFEGPQGTKREGQEAIADQG
jgi:hypothetical protein